MKKSPPYQKVFNPNNSPPFDTQMNAFSSPENSLPAMEVTRQNPRHPKMNA